MEGKRQSVHKQCVNWASVPMNGPRARERLRGATALAAVARITTETLHALNATLKIHED